jgi:plastocyanin
LASRSDHRRRCALALALGAGLAIQARTAAGEAPGGLAGSIKVVRLKVGSGAFSFDNVLVYLEDAPRTGGLPRGPFQIEQSEKHFRPRLLVVPKGASVAFPNNDEFSHNVFSTTPGNSFDLGLYRPGSSKSEALDNPGVVSIYCNVHPQMVAHILVVTNAFFMHPKSDGSFAFDGVPPGTYHLAVWFAEGPPLRREVVIEPGRTLEVKLELREYRGADRHLDKSGLPYGNYSAEGRTRRANGVPSS